MRSSVASIVLALVFVACSDSDDRKSLRGDAGDAGKDADSGTSPADAAADTADAVADTVSDTLPDALVLPDGVIAGVPYTCESPFAGVRFSSYFHLENWEDGALNTPGATASSTQLSSSFGPSLIDSIDCDDGATDGTCVDCEALWASGTVEVTFDGTALGGLPTHTGLVWTDGGFGADVTITAFDASDQPVDTRTVSGIGDNSNSGTVAEDRFFGIVHMAGIRRIVVVNSSGGVEIDHLQYGR
jgi:hypothetical protein